MSEQLYRRFSPLGDHLENQIPKGPFVIHEWSAGWPEEHNMFVSNDTLTMWRVAYIDVAIQTGMGRLVKPSK